MAVPEMTPRERFLYAFTHREGDRVPLFDCIANPHLFTSRLGRENYHFAGGPAIELIRALGMDACQVLVGGYTSAIGSYQNWIAPDKFVDEFGVPHTVSSASWPLAMASAPGFPDRAAWEKTPRPDPLADWRFDAVREAVQTARDGKGDDVAVVAGVRGAFTVIFISMGFDNMALAVYDDEDLLAEMSAYFTDFWIKAGIRAVECGADALYVANDMGFNTNTLLSPETMRKIFLPDLARQVKALRATGAKVILHSCGCVNPILADLVDTGIDAITNLQVSAGMDLAQVKRDFGDRVTIIGNVDSTNVLSGKSKQAIEDEVRLKLRIGAPGGGFVLGTDHSFHMGISEENLDCYLACARKYGAYPIRA